MPTTNPAPCPVERVTTLRADALPLIKAMLDELEVSEIINELVPNPTGEFSYGDLAAVVITSRLDGLPVPLYEMSAWASKNAVPALFDIPAEKLNDDRLGDMLDKLRPHRRTIWGWLITRTIRRFGVDIHMLHADPTKIAFEGSYAGQEALPPDVPRLAYGKPKDGQGDRLLLTLSALVTEDGGLPVWFGLDDGNQADDPTYLETLREMRGQLALPEVLVLSGDNKLPSRGNLLDLCGLGYQFVATEPTRAKRRKRLEKLWRQGVEWDAMDYVAEAERNKPAAERGQYAVIVDTDRLQDDQTGKTYPVRRLYVRSSRKAEQAAAKRLKHLTLLETELQRIRGLLNKYDYTTRDIVQTRVTRLLGKYPEGRQVQVTVRKTRSATAPLQMTWRFQRKKLRAAARWDGVYSLITNLPAETHTPRAALEIYKDQHRVEGRFRDMNQLPLRVRPVWLKNPERIETLVFLVLVAALLFAVLERQVRHFVAERQCPLRGVMPEKRDTLQPSAKRLLLAFVGVELVRIEDAERGVRWLLGELTEVQRQVLQALGLAELSAYFQSLAQRQRQSAPAPRA